MPRLSCLFALSLLLLIPMVASAQNCLLDPVTTFTNGMPLPSTTSQRSHNVNYQCDPERIGCCNGRYNLPCLNSLLCPNDCCTGARPAGYPEPDHGSAGVEPVQFEQISTIPNRLAAGAVGN